MAAAGGHHDTSSCSTAATEQSDRRKRSSTNDDEVSFKPYECRFCPMKFAKSQALGGHMNRHRQEREREQVVQARQLLMQQEFSSAILMSGQNPPSALPKLSQAHLQRSASEGSLKDGIRRMGTPPPFGGASAYRGLNFQPNLYNNSLLIGAPSMNWNLGNILETPQNSESAFGSFDRGMIPSYHGRQQAYCPTLNNNSSYILPPQPLSRVHSQHDIMPSVPYDKGMQLSMYPFDSNTPTAHRSNSLPSLQNQTEEESILAGAADAATNLLPSNRSLVHSDMKNAYSSSEVLSLPSQQNNVAHIGNGFQFFSYHGAVDAARSSLDVNLSSTNQLDGLPWMHASSKTTRTSNALPTANVEYHQNLENSAPKMEDGSLTGTNSEQAKTIMRWDLPLSSPDDNVEEESKIRDLTPPVIGGGGGVQLDTSYDNASSAVEGKESIND